MRYIDDNLDTFTTKINSDLKKKAVRGGGITMATHILDYAIQIGSTAIIARILTPSDYGLVAISLAATGFFFVFKTLGLSDATVQRATITHKQISNLFWINVATGCFFALILIALSPFVAKIYKDQRLAGVINLSSLSFIFSGLYTQHQALLKRSMRFSALAVNEIIGMSVSVIVAVLLALAGTGYWVLVLRPLILSISVMTGCWILCKWRPGLPGRNSGVLPMLKFGINTIGYYMVEYIAKNTDKALIGLKEGQMALGFYSRAFQLFLAPVSQLTLPLTGVAVATLSKLQNEPLKYHSYFLNATHTLALIGFPFSMFLVANSRPLIFLLLGENWAPAAEIFTILGLSGGIQLITSTRAWLFVSLGRTDRWFQTGLAASILMALFILAGIQFGVKGVATAYTTFVFLSLVPSLWYAGAPIGLKFQAVLSVLWKPFIAASIGAIVNKSILTTITALPDISKLAIASAVYILTYTITLLLLYRSNKPFKDLYSLFLLLFPSRIRSKNVNY
ncbi:MAG TPA: lipopolysaccharide biosynthesis protein [Chitinispirillaceae bacterium]|nr:lipopolysaccharide biosynthesis protein [Chitinispirillaceae bacterium]